MGDVVVVKDPEKSDNLLVRRLAAVEGYEMVSKDEKDESFVLEKDQCWVLADNDTLKPKVSANSMFENLMRSNLDRDVIQLYLSSLVCLYFHMFSICSTKSNGFRCHC